MDRMDRGRFVGRSKAPRVHSELLERLDVLLMAHLLCFSWISVIVTKLIFAASRGGVNAKVSAGNAVSTFQLKVETAYSSGRRAACWVAGPSPWTRRCSGSARPT